MFTKANKQKSKLRLAITGVSGAGKTYSALRIASGLSDKIAFIDTERGSASKYSDKFNFDVCELQAPYSISEYQDKINFCNGKYDVLIIDSLSHAWDYLLDQVEKISKVKHNGNFFKAWTEGTPMQNKFINTILESDCHIIACLRSKMEYTIDQNDRGKMSIKKVGLAPMQRAGVEYEFDLVMEGTVDHFFTISKDRTGKFQDKILEKPDENFGIELGQWLAVGIDKKAPTIESVSKEVDKLLSQNPSEISEIKSDLEKFIELGDSKSFKNYWKTLNSDQKGLLNDVLLSAQEKFSKTKTEL